MVDYLGYQYFFEYSDFILVEIQQPWILKLGYRNLDIETWI